MRQIIHILFSVFYLSSIVGVPVHVHYCKGDLVSVGFLNASEECCCVEEVEVKACCSEKSDDKSCQVSMEDECCSFDHLFIQYDEENQVYKNPILSSNSAKDQLVFHSFTISNSDNDSDSEESLYITHPPPIPQPLWLLHCNFTFYG